MKSIPQKILDYVNQLSKKDAFNSLVEDMGFTPREAADILDVYIFEDIQFLPHGVVPGAIQGSFGFPNPNGGEDHWISIDGGGEGLYGDGTTTFEVWGSDMEDPEGWVTKEKVTQKLLELQ